MAIQKKWGFGFGTIFSLIVVYFIFLYSRDKGWSILALISKWYLIIVGGLIALSFGIFLLVIILSLFAFLITIFRLKSFGKKHKKQEDKKLVDAEYEIKE